MRGWYEGAQFDIGDPARASMVYVLRASGGPVPLFAWLDSDESSGGIFVQRGIRKDLKYVHAKPPAPQIGR